MSQIQELEHSNAMLRRLTDLLFAELLEVPGAWDRVTKRIFAEGWFIQGTRPVKAKVL